MIYTMVVTFYIGTGITSQIVSYHSTLEACQAAAKEATQTNIAEPSTKGFCFVSTGLETE